MENIYYACDFLKPYIQTLVQLENIKKKNKWIKNKSLICWFIVYEILSFAYLKVLGALKKWKKKGLVNKFADCYEFCNENLETLGLLLKILKVYERIYLKLKDLNNCFTEEKGVLRLFSWSVLIK